MSEIESSVYKRVIISSGWVFPGLRAWFLNRIESSGYKRVGVVSLRCLQD